MNNLTYEGEIVRLATKYFAMSEDEIASALIRAKKKKDFSESYLYSILISAEPHFARYIKDTPIDLQRKIGRVAFDGLNYSTFPLYETPSEMRYRLAEFFNMTNNYGINPYKIFYSTVISKAHLFYNKEGRYSNYKRDISNFEAVSRAIEEQLGLDRAKIAKMYERCSSLSYKVDTEKVAKNYRAIRRLSYNSEFIFNNIDVKEILRNNPTLYSCSENQIESAFNYLKKKAEIYKHRNKDTRFVKDILNSWIKNNSSSLAINVEGMKSKERALYSFLTTIASKDEVASVLYSIFDNPTSISTINKISSDTFFRHDNYMKVIKTLIYYLDNPSKEKYPISALNYLKHSKLVYSIDHKRLNAFLDKVKNCDIQDNTNLMQKFVEKGDAIYSYFDKYTDDEIIEKLRTNKILFRIKLYNMTKSMIAHKFYEVFSHNPDEKFNYLNDLLRENYNLELICFHINDAEKSLLNLKDALKKEEKILPFAKAIEEFTSSFMGVYYQYEEKYLKTSFDEAMNLFLKKVDRVKEEIDTLYNEGVDDAKKLYDNVEALYNAFKQNTGEKLSKNNNPITRREEFKNQLNEVIESLEKEVGTKQLSIYDYKDEDDDIYEALNILKGVRARFNTFDSHVEKEKC